MNELIKELAEQAELPLLDVDGNCKYGDTYFSKEKFAELIIEHCAKHALDFNTNIQSLTNKEMRSHSIRVSDYIKDRMGVLND